MNITANTPAHVDAEAFYDKHYAQAERDGYIAQRKQEIKDAELDVKLGESFKRLENNEDFIAVIEEAYINANRNRLTKALGSRLSPDVREDCSNQLMAVGGLQVFLEGLMQKAAGAGLALPALKDDLAQVQTEAL